MTRDQERAVRDAANEFAHEVLTVVGSELDDETWEAFRARIISEAVAAVRGAVNDDGRRS